MPTPTRTQQSREGLHLLVLRAAVWFAVAMVFVVPLASGWGSAAAAASAVVAVVSAWYVSGTRIRWPWTLAAAAVILICGFGAARLAGGMILPAQMMGPGRVLTLIELLTFGSLAWAVVLALRSLTLRWPLFGLFEAVAIVGMVAFSFRSHRKFPFSQPQLLSDWAFIQGHDPRHVIMWIGLAALVGLGLLLLPRHGWKRTTAAAVLMLLLACLFFPWLFGPVQDAFSEAATAIGSSPPPKTAPSPPQPKKAPSNSPSQAQSSGDKSQPTPGTKADKRGSSPAPQSGAGQSLVRPPADARKPPPPPPVPPKKPPRISIKDARVVEGNVGSRTLDFQLELSEPQNRPVTVNVRTSEGTANPDNDFRPDVRTVEFPAGRTKTSVTVAVASDTEIEPDETLFVTLSNPVHAEIEREKATGTIGNDDREPEPRTLSIADTQLEEGNAGLRSANFTVTLSSAAEKPVEVIFDSANGSAQTIQDYFSGNGRLVIQPGETKATIMVSVVGDDKKEKDETFVVKLSKPVNATLARELGTATIVNDDDVEEPPMRISIDDVGECREGDIGTTAAEFVVRLSRPVRTLPIEVTYTTVPGKATDKQDFRPKQGKLKFNSGQTRLSVEVVGDDLVEADEEFFVQLSEPLNAELGRSRGSATIQNDDFYPELSIAPTRPTVSNAETGETIATIVEGNEGTRPLDFKVTMSKPWRQDVEFRVATVAGTAVADQDFQPLDKTFSIPTGKTETSVSMRVRGDHDVEPHETFDVKISEPVNATIKVDNARAQIRNDDTYPAITLQDASVQEGDAGTTWMEFFVELNKPSHEPIRVPYSVTRYRAVAAKTKSSTKPASRPKNSGKTIGPSPSKSPGKSEPAKTAPDTSTPNKSPPDKSPPDKSTPSKETPNKSKANMSLFEKQGDRGLLTHQPPRASVRFKRFEGEKPWASALRLMREIDEQSFPTDSMSAPRQSIVSQIVLAQEDTTPSKTIPKKTTSDKVAPSKSTPSKTESSKSPPSKKEPSKSGPEKSAGKGSASQAEEPAPSKIEQQLRRSLTDNEAEQRIRALLIAEADKDFLPHESELVIPANVTRATIRVQVVGDKAAELDERLTVELGKPVQATVARSVATGTIVNDDPFPQVKVVDAKGQEGDGGESAVVFTIELSQPSATPVEIGYETADGTARAGEDYQPKKGKLTIPPGEVVATIPVPIIGDAQSEPPESFSLKLKPPDNAELGNNEASGSIDDKDKKEDKPNKPPEPPIISIDSVALDEGSAGQTAFTFTVKLSSATDKEVEVRYSTAGVTAKVDDDLARAEGQVKVPPGKSEANITVNVVGDTKVETDERFEIRLSDPRGGTLGDENKIGIGTIKNDDKPSLSIDDVKVVEGQTGLSEARFTLKLSEAPLEAVQVKWTTTQKSAVLGEDFEPVQQVTTIPPGKTETPLVVLIKGDQVAEPDETFEVALSEPVGAKLDRDLGVGTIQNDDDPDISIEGLERAEGDQETTAFEFRVKLSSATNKDVEFRSATATELEPAPGTGRLRETATAGEDFKHVDTVLTIPAGQIEKIVSVAVVGETKIERDEAFRVQLSGVKNAKLEKGRDSATAIIQNDDLPKLSIADVQVVEGNSGTTLAKFAVTLSEPMFEDVPVTYVSVAKTAATKEDYQAAKVQLTIPKGQVKADAKIQIIADTKAEPDETFGVRLIEPVNARLDRDFGTGTIVNDDDPEIWIEGNQCSEGDEGTSAFEFQVLLSEKTTKDVRVRYATKGDSAMVDEDFKLATGELTIPAGELQGNVSVDIAGDLRIERNEKLIIVLSEPVNATLRAEKSVADGTIVNDDWPKLTVKDVLVSEVWSANFELKISEPGLEDIQLKYSTVPVTAQTPQDFVPREGTLKVAAGETSVKPIIVQITNDKLVESSETFELRFSEPVNVKLERSVAVGTIANDDLHELTIEDFEAQEGHSGQTPFTFKVKLSQPSEYLIKFDYDCAGPTATNYKDFEKPPGWATIPAGQTEATIIVQVKGDNEVEEDETFYVTLKKAQVAKIGPRRATGKIINDDFKPPPELLVDDVVVEEGQIGSTAMQFTLRLSDKANRLASVHYAVVADSATAQQDFVPAEGDITFPVGEQEATVSVNIVGDSDVEPDETIKLRLSNPVHLVLKRPTAQGTIRNDDQAPPPPEISIGDARVNEGQQETAKLAFSVRLSRVAPSDIEVQYTTGGGTAHPDDDYRPGAGTVTIPAGQSEAVVAVEVIGDTNIEPDETLLVQLVSPRGANLRRDQATGTIVDDDAGTGPHSDELNWGSTESPPLLPLALVTFTSDHEPVEKGFYFRTFVYSRLEAGRLTRAPAIDNDICWSPPSSHLRLPAISPRDVIGDFSHDCFLLGESDGVPGLVSPVNIAPRDNPAPQEFRAAYSVTSQVLIPARRDRKSIDPIADFAMVKAGSSEWDETKRAHYLAVPDDRRYQELASKIATTIDAQQRQSPLARAVAVRKWMETNLIYDFNPVHEAAEDPTASFLFGDRRGYCIHLAHAMTMLMRCQGIPARLAVGYRVGTQRRGQRRGVMIYASDAHAWAEVYLEGAGWLVVESATKGRIPPPVPEPDPRELDYYLSLLSDVPPEVYASDSGGGVGGMVAMGASTGVTVGIVGLYVIKFYRLLWPLFAGTALLYRRGYRSVLDRLAMVGIRRQYGETWDEFAGRIRDLSPEFHELTEMHLRCSFGGGDLDENRWRELQTELTRGIARKVPRARRMLGLANPLSWIGVG